MPVTPRGRRRLAAALLWLWVAVATPLAAQELEWARAVGGTENEFPAAVAVAPDGSSYTVGFFQGPADFDPGPGVFTLTPEGGQGGYLSKLDPEGSFAWAIAIDSAQADLARDVTTDSAGNVYVVGTFRQTIDFDPGPDVFNVTTNTSSTYVLKLDAGANFVWVRVIGGSAQGRGIAVDSSHGVYVTGWFWHSVDLDPGPGTFTVTTKSSFPDQDTYVVKLDAAGDFVWGGQLGGAGADTDPERIAVDSTGAVLAVGQYEGAVDLDPGPGSLLFDSGTHRFGYAVKLDPAGNLLWAHSLGSGISNTVIDAVFDRDDGIALTGYFWGTVDFDPGAGTAELTSVGAQDPFIWKLTGAGEHVWARHAGASGTDTAVSVAVDALGNAYAMGTFRGTADFDPGPDTFSLTSQGPTSDSFLWKLTAGGDFAWAVRIGGEQQIDAAGVDLDAAGDVYAAGLLRGTVDFDPGADAFELTSAGRADGFLVKLHQPRAACRLNEVKKLVASNAAPFHVLSYRADIDGDTAIAGTFPEGDPQGQVRSAYVFERHAGGADDWGEVAELISSDRRDGDFFGAAVAVSGSTAIVGAKKADGLIPASGAAYVFERDGAGAWIEVGKIVDPLPENTVGAGDELGKDVAVEGDVVAVSTNNSKNVFAVGAVLVFQRGLGGTGDWGLVQRIEPFDGQLGDGFGFDIALEDGVLVVGSAGDDDLGSSSGSAYVYARDQGGPDNWGLVKKIRADDGAADDRFGFSVAKHGDVIAVGAWGHDGSDVDSGAVYIFERHAGGLDNWGLVQERAGSASSTDDAFGWSVAVAGDAVVVGAPGADDDLASSGEIYVFERHAGGLDNWGETHRYLSPDAVGGSSFGWEVRSDGDRILVGAIADSELGFRAGAAYVFECRPAEAAVDADGDGFGPTLDCDDGDPAIHPGAAEVCNGVDDDCSGQVDEGLDGDLDGTADCFDGCPADAGKTAPGVCGCGTADTDGDGDGTSDCLDLCVADPNKTAPGICGCGVLDLDTDGDATPDCHDLCAADPLKLEPGICGCGVEDVDADGDGAADCVDGCGDDPQKDAPGICGCGVPDLDTDGDGAADCLDACPLDANKVDAGVCGCGAPDTDTDADGVPDCVDLCAADPAKIDPGVCGCGTADTDGDGDGAPDCVDPCAADPLKIDPGVCGCGIDDSDTDGDGVADCHDLFPDSDLSPTVVIGGCDSGVGNLLLEDGATISDLVGACAAAAASHGQLVSCVSHLTNELKRDGLLTGAEKSAITSCAGQSGLP